MSRKIGCDAARARLSARAAGLSDAERIALEEHVEGCAECARFGREIDALARVLDAGPSLGAGARERVIERALAARAEPVGGRVRLVSRRAAVGVAALAAAAALAIWVGADEPDETPRSGFASKAEPSVEVVPDAPPEPSSVPALEPESERNRALAEGERLRFAHAELRAIDSARFDLDRATTTVTLTEGSIAFDVDPSAHAPFAVVYAGHRIEVLGTEFIVGNGRVEVRHGVVRVIRLDGRVRATLRAGRSLVLEEAAPPARAELARARSLLSRGNVRAAKAILSSIDRSALSPADRAEAGSLDAEAHAASGDRSRAIAAYLRVADDYRELPAAGNALFAAGRLAAEARDSARARTIFERYLALHPNGRFASEARRRIEEARGTR